MKFGYKLLVQCVYQKCGEDGQVLAESNPIQFTPAMTAQSFDAVRDTILKGKDAFCAEQGIGPKVSMAEQKTKTRKAVK